MTRICLTIAFCVAVWPAWTGTARAAASREDGVVRMAKAVLDESVTVPLRGIPHSLLADAHGIAIIPNLVKGSFVIGARHGRGVLVVRSPEGDWQRPVFISLTGGNVGWQIGLQTTDLVLVFRTRQSVEGILSGKFTIGADVAAAAGPAGRQAAAATDGRLKAEILSYSRSRGLFVGVSIDGSVLQIEPTANAAYYGTANPSEAAQVPESADSLVMQIAAYCNMPQVEPAEFAPAPSPALAPATAADVERNQLAHTAPRLYRVLDDTWRAYLALPSEVFAGGSHPLAAALSRPMAHFDTVAIEPRYRELAQRPEFQSAYHVLKQYAATLAQPSQPLNLPPPPIEVGAETTPSARY